jgi:hypothetical protein
LKTKAVEIITRKTALSRQQEWEWCFKDQRAGTALYKSIKFLAQKSQEFSSQKYLEITTLLRVRTNIAYQCFVVPGCKSHISYALSIEEFVNSHSII